MENNEIRERLLKKFEASKRAGVEPIPENLIEQVSGGYEETVYGRCILCQQGTLFLTVGSKGYFLYCDFCGYSVSGGLDEL